MKPSSHINFFNQDVDFHLPNKKLIKEWLKAVAAIEHVHINQINYIFCNDEYLLKLNRQYLNHNTLTDIITFQQDENPGIVSADIFISIQRVQQNSTKFKTTFAQELHRVIVHGLLHLCGYKDKTPAAKKKMRSKEDSHLARRDPKLM